MPLNNITDTESKLSVGDLTPEQIKKNRKNASAQRSKNRLYLNKTQVTDANILATHENDKGRHTVIKDGVKVEVETACQLRIRKLYFNRTLITDETILASHFKDGAKHYVNIDGETQEVKTASQLYHNSFYLNGVKLKHDDKRLDTYFTRSRKHYIKINDQEIEIQTVTQRNHQLRFIREANKQSASKLTITPVRKESSNPSTDKDENTVKMVKKNRSLSDNKQQKIMGQTPDFGTNQKSIELPPVTNPSSNNFISQQPSRFTFFNYTVPTALIMSCTPTLPFSDEYQIPGSPCSNN